MTKYIITAPVSGCIKVSMEGRRTIISVLKIKKASFLIVGLSYVLLKLLIITAKISIKLIFINSLGCMLPIPGITNQHLLLFIGLPKNNSKSSDRQQMIYIITACLYK